MTVVRMKHVRAIGGCSKGARYFCQENGIDWSSFLTNGVEASVLDATGDAMARKLTDHARKEEADGRRG